MSLPWRLLGGSVVLMLAFSFGVMLGRDWEMDRQDLRVAEAQRRAIEATNERNRVEAERLAIQRERDALALELEDAARADPDASRPALSAGSVLRLNKR